jgi:hypothetical protein
MDQPGAPAAAFRCRAIATVWSGPSSVVGVSPPVGLLVGEVVVAGRCELTPVFVIPASRAARLAAHVAQPGLGGALRARAGGGPPAPRRGRADRLARPPAVRKAVAHATRDLRPSCG